jgi:hypothetical protein
VAKKKIKKGASPRGLQLKTKRKNLVLSKTSTAIVILALLCLGLFIVILALQKPQVIKPHAQTISGTQCRAAAGICDPVHTCSTFETDGGQMDCEAGQTCCINPSTNSNPGVTITVTPPIPSAACLGSCTGESGTPSPTMQQPTTSQPTTGLTQTPGTTATPIPTQSISATPSTTVPSSAISQNPSVSPIAQTSTTPSPELNNNDLLGFLKQILEFILKLLQSLIGGGSHHSGGSNHAGDKDHDRH